MGLKIHHSLQMASSKTLINRATWIAAICLNKASMSRNNRCQCQCLRQVHHLSTQAAALTIQNNISWKLNQRWMLTLHHSNLAATNTWANLLQFRIETSTEAVPALCLQHRSSLLHLFQAGRWILTRAVSLSLQRQQVNQPILGWVRQVQFQLKSTYHLAIR